MVNIILAKEKLLTDEANRMIDGMKQSAIAREVDARNLARACNRQLDVLNFSFSVKSEGELLPLLPALACRVEADKKRMEGQREDREVTGITFAKDDNCFQTLKSSPLGRLEVEKKVAEAPEPAKEGKVDLSLTLMTSFHGGTRDDVVDPLLTDIVLLMNGDVITTDRDNKCVKKFNQSGKLLTRVLIEAVPSRIVVVSHSKAAVSVMNKKVIYFLSLFGTVRILSSVRVKKFYSFLASLGGGVMVAATNQCDCIDILTEKGEIIKNIFAQKADRASIARPMYLTPAVAYSTINDSVRAPPTPVQAAASNSATTGQQDILVSDSGKKILFRLDQSGHVAFTLKSSSSVALDCPLGITVHESGLILLADRDTNSIVLLDGSGNVMRKILTSDQGLAKPCGIYAGHKGQVALTQVDGMVKVYTSQVVAL
ncbi:unnamed protein product [Lymnaea stagnalis]|uniref:Uncharacterized protein n=1 Tax=Lymnaea stagnalis TaxID=6523 RepID=A0AAV2II49_LYMST